MWEEKMTDLELMTLIIAIWGAGLATILGVIEILNKRRKLKAANGIHYIAIQDGQQEAAYSLACVNDGERIIRLDSFGIELPNGRMIGFRDQHPDPQPFPITLNDGEVFGVLAFGRQLIPLFRAANYVDVFKVRGYFRDTSGRIYYSKKITVFFNDLYRE